MKLLAPLHPGLQHEPPVEPMSGWRVVWWFWVLMGAVSAWKAAKANPDLALIVGACLGGLLLLIGMLYLLIWLIARAWGNGSHATELQLLRHERDSWQRIAGTFQQAAEDWQKAYESLANNENS